MMRMQSPNSAAKMTKYGSTKLANMMRISPPIHIGNYFVAHITYELTFWVPGMDNLSPISFCQLFIV